MYIDISPYQGTKRVRIVKRQMEGSKWTTKLVKHIGTAKCEEELEILKEIAHKERLKLANPGQMSFDLDVEAPSSLYTLGFYNHGADVILGRIFDSLHISIGRMTPLLKLLTIARIVHPGSKRDTARWMEETLGSSYSLDQVYRFLDVVIKKRSPIETSLRDSITKRYPEALSYLIYDVTTIYFEKDDEDPDVESGLGLRKRGYSKDHRNDLPQVVLGLCVNELGMPLSHNLYPGHTYEGNTLIDSIQKTRQSFKAMPLTVVADAGMLSAKNLAAIVDAGMGYIMSARIKNLESKLTDKILTHDFQKSPVLETRWKEARLIVAYSRKRARADAKRREAAVARLEKLIAEGKAIRRHRFLDFRVKEKPSLDERAIETAARYDGLKGYTTNNFELSTDEVISHYSQLPVVEQSFRMTKSDLKIRPVYHQREQRIEAHVILCMISLCVMRILEEKVRAEGITYYDAIDIIKKTNSAVIGNSRKSHLIPPLYSEKFRAILNATRAS